MANEEHLKGTDTEEALKRLENPPLKLRDLPVVMGVFALLIVLISSMKDQPSKAVELFSLSENKIIPLLMTLATLALIIERAVEILVGPTKLLRHQDVGIKIITKEKELEAASKTAVPSVRVAFDELKLRELRWNGAIQKEAFRYALLVAFFMAVVGVRTLGGLVDITSIPPESWQALGFQFVDIFVTTLLLAGGSDGIHKIVKIVTSWAEVKEDKIKKGGQAS